MRIAQIAPIIERVPPTKYGGTERVVSLLTDELVARGHDVTLFATADSLTKARLVSITPRALREAGVSNYTDLLLCNGAQAYKRQFDFDIIHDHNGVLGAAFAQCVSTPTVVTLHGALSKSKEAIFRNLQKAHLVSISNSQRNGAPDLRYAATIYNGLNMDHFPISRTHEEYLLFVGRISEEKGVHIAIEAAQKSGRPLIIAAKLDPSPKDQVYFKTYIEPNLSGQIRWIGEVTEDERNLLMSKAYCSLHPVTWPEPFGLTLIEAMACGCPVIAFGMGSIPEIILDKKSGFVVSSLDCMLDAISMIPILNREFCRSYALSQFNHVRMVDGYEKLYSKIIISSK